MSLLLNVSAVSVISGWKVVVPRKHFIASFPSSNSCNSSSKLGGFRVRAFIFNPAQDPIVKEALKDETWGTPNCRSIARSLLKGLDVVIRCEPVAFLGGMFAGFLRLDLNEDPLSEWVARTVEASAITEEEISSSRDVQAEDVPQLIEIE